MLKIIVYEKNIYCEIDELSASIFYIYSIYYNIIVICGNN